MTLRLSGDIIFLSYRTSRYNRVACEKGVMWLEQIVPKRSVGKRTYSVDEIRSILNIGRRKAYELCNSGEFKIVRIGRTIRISKLSFDEWLDNITDNGGI